MKSSKLILMIFLSSIVVNVHAGNDYYFHCSHLNLDAERGLFSTVKKVNKSVEEIDTQELVNQFALSVKEPGRTACYGGSDYDEVWDGRERGMKFLEDKGWDVGIRDRQDFFDYVKNLND
ncbi:hypothetical protein V6347_18805 [Acinetobacter baumannii]|uniref:hypothetical protein n=1 Tax=Acinetobacter baumannii TaxID=470 RepID=UPI0021480B7E|nr:hypothetical protein [Acinetobacter baumannii]MCR0008297.1 hypothetical protein [Acinetobacter baumannii]MCZ3010200.1 hypothetical protein [Acinetobacter baumannii]HAV3580446.1 hypothetical protein [Acinetobacter baumannii]